ncbi:MAG: glycosyltransferase, partial [Candidatus Cloacimonetes bacterium]|nr:glycosyltransferase [Candidatus Cloacimonadota bacterium]
PKRRGILRNIFDFIFLKKPNYFLMTYSKFFLNKVAEMAKEEHYDCIISEYSMMAQYIYNNRGIPSETKKIMSVHECYTIARRKLMRAKGFSREGIKAFLYYVKLVGYEFKMYESADLVLTLTYEGKEELLRYNPRLKVKVVPHGVDVDYFNLEERKPEKNSIMFLGNFGHLPNVDGIIYFCKVILPMIRKKIPDAKLYIVGQNPNQEIKDFDEKDKVIVTGFVDSVKPYFDLSMISIVPVRLGGGFRGKALEAMSCGLPLVSTDLGAEGIHGKDGEHFLIADKPEDFAEKVCQVLTDKDLYQKLSVNGRKLMEDEYSWQKGVEKLENILEKLTAE